MDHKFDGNANKENDKNWIPANRKYFTFCMNFVKDCYMLTSLQALVVLEAAISVL